MIKLSDVSTRKLYSKIVNRENDAKTIIDVLEWIEIINIFDDNNIYDYQKLKEKLRLFEQSPFFNFIKEDLAKVERKINEANILEKEPEIYTQDWYQGIDVDDKSLFITDNNTMGSALLISSLLRPDTRKQCIIKHYTIAELKFCLSHLQSNLKNEFRIISGCYSKDDLLKLKERLNFYEQQVRRQAKDLKENKPYLLPTNLFTANSKIKQEIIELELTEIAEYLADSGTEFFWGTLSDNDRLKLLKIVKQPNHFARKKLITAISDYVTLTEAERGLVKTKTLDRFKIK